MNTKATSLPLAALAAAVRSLSLVEDVTVVPSAFDLVVMASSGCSFPGARQTEVKRRSEVLTLIRYGKSAVLFAVQSQ